MKKDSWTLGWIRADNGSWVTGGAKRNVLTARAGGMEVLLQDVALRAGRDALDRVMNAAKPRTKKPRLRLVASN